MKSTLKKTEKGITLVALVVTIVVLLMLAGVSINMLLGDNGIITMAKKAKDAYEKAAKKEQQQLAGVFESDYATYNGKLSVNGPNLVNEKGEKVQLKGFGTTYWYLTTEDFSVFGGVSGKTYRDYYNQESMASIKKWGANCVRVIITRQLYLQDENNINKVYDIIDDCISQDLYVLVNWHCFNDPNTNISDNIEFYTKIASRYKDSSNVLYEIYNEPCGDAVTWDVIKTYANQIIPKIREIDDDAIIIAPTPNYDKNITDVINNTLDYNNIMYSYHVYVGANDMQEEMEKLRKCLINGIPIFVTEWGTTQNDGLTGFYENESNLLVKFCENNNISWCYFSMCDCHFNRPEGGAIVKERQWQNDLNDEILTTSGKYIKQVLTRTRDSYNALTSSNMMIYGKNNGYAFWDGKYKDNITTIVFENKINIPNDAVKTWDVSYVYNSKRVWAYIVNNQDAGYDLHIQADGNIEAPYNAWALFAKFGKVKKIDFTNFDTSKTTSFMHMFNGDSTLEKLDLSGFNTEKVINMDSMFSGCTKLSELNLTSFNTSNVKKMSGMFAMCKALKDLDVSNFDTSNVTNMNTMFNFSYVNGDLNLNGFDTTKVTTIQSIFGSATITGTLDISSWNLKNITNYDKCFENFSSFAKKVFVKDEENAKLLTNMGLLKTIQIYYKVDGQYQLYLQ